MGYGRDPTVAARIILARLLLARCVQQQVPMVDDSLQFIDVVNVPVIVRDCGSAQIQVIANSVDIPARNRDRYSTFSIGSDDGF